MTTTYTRSSMNYPLVNPTPNTAVRTDKQNVPRLLIVDDEPLLLNSVLEILNNRGYVLDAAGNADDAMHLLKEANFDIVILDLDLGRNCIVGNGMLDFLLDRKLDVDVIVTSGAHDIDAAIGAMRRGICDYLRKPYVRDDLLKAVRTAIRHRMLRQENVRFAEKLEESERNYCYLVDNSPDIYYRLDKRGCLTFVNNRVKFLLGFEREDLIGKHYSELVHCEDLKRVQVAFENALINPTQNQTIDLRLTVRGVGHDHKLRSFASDFRLMRTTQIRFQIEKGKFVGVFGIARDVTDQNRVERLLVRQANYDALTDLPNRSLFREGLAVALLQARRTNTCLAVMFVDLDRFKLVNDTLGHVVGDELLKQTALRLKDCVRSEDTLARQGGDEFTIFVPNLVSRSDAALVAEKIKACLEQPFLLSGNVVHISASIGLAVFPTDGGSVEDLIRNSDMAMYQAKENGKNTFTFYHVGLEVAAQQKATVEQTLREAIIKLELEMYYQPQINVVTRKVVGVEALMRWNHPQRGLLTAGEFLPFAEESGLMIPLTTWMVDAVCADIKSWRAKCVNIPQVSINISPLYLDRGDFDKELHAKLIEYDVSPGQLEVEITENIAIRNIESAIEQLDKLARLGVSVAIDDFGTGYSSLSYLHRFRINTLKIDRAFVMQIQSTEMQYPMVLAIISIAKSLGFNLVAEGVETQLQADYLAASGCFTMQGYLYHRPLCKAKFLDLLN